MTPHLTFLNVVRHREDHRKQYTSQPLTKVAPTLRIARSILVALLAVAIATLPGMTGFASAAQAAPAVTAVAQATPDCESHRHMHHAPVKQTQKSADHGTCITGCALCFGVVSAHVSAVAYTLLTGTALMPVHAPDEISSLMGSPPFRPPRA